MSNYTLTVSSDELELIARVLHRDLGAKLVTVKAPRAPKTPRIAHPDYDTGISALDNWLNARRDPFYVSTLKAPEPYKPVYKKTPLPKSFFTVERDWNQLCDQAWSRPGVTPN